MSDSYSSASSSPSSSSAERAAFEQYAMALFAEVTTHRDRDSIEIETVFPRWTPNVVIVVPNTNKASGDKHVYCGHPTVDRIDADTYLLLPSSTECEFADGIEVFGVVDLPTLGDAVQFSATKVYVALLNEKNGNKYHLFPSLSPSKRTRFVDALSKCYADLVKTSEDFIPNYILKSVRNAGATQPSAAGASMFRPVIKQLLQKAWDSEHQLASKRVLSHDFGSSQFKDIYQRFKYLSEQPHSGVNGLRTTTTVDIAASHSSAAAGADSAASDSAAAADSADATRISLHGARAFDDFCTKYKELATPAEIAEYVVRLDASACEIMQKTVLTATDLRALHELKCHDGFKLNVKREKAVAVAASYKKQLTAFFQPEVVHTYRCKKRYSFDCGGFALDLTMVRQGADKHAVFRPTPFIALEQMRTDRIRYEFELECTDLTNPQSAVPRMMQLMDECSLAMRKGMLYFGQHVAVSAYPLLMDEPSSAEAIRRFNALPCHAGRQHGGEPLVVNNSVGPNVVNMTHANHAYVRHHMDSYNILVKTDGVRCLAHVDKAAQRLCLFVQKADYCMNLPLASVPSASYALDGEFYFQNGHCTFFVFDVYCKDDASLLELPFGERMAMLDEPLRVREVNLVVKKKQPLSIAQYQELYTEPNLTEDQRRTRERFECYDAGGLKAKDDGFILMHTGAMVVDLTDDAEEEVLKVHGTKPYIMRRAEYVAGHKSVSYMSQQQKTAYVFCLKWKPEEECTIDFKLQLLDHDPSLHGASRLVRMCSKYSPDDTEINLFTVLGALSTKRTGRHALLCPHTLPHKVHSFQPSEKYEYELASPVVDGVELGCDSHTGHIMTNLRELVHDGDIVEMQYHAATAKWTPLRLRADKTEPNRYSVALANWKNIFSPVQRPLKWVRPALAIATAIATATATATATEQYDASVLSAYYTMRKKVSGSSQLDNIHLLIKQHLILKSARVWTGAQAPSSTLTAYEVGCGKGTDLFHWGYVNEHIRAIAFLLGTDWDTNGLVRPNGIYSNYLRGGKGHPGQRITNLENKYDFDALFVQANARASLEQCRDCTWESSLDGGSAGGGGGGEQRVSTHKLHYQILRHVLFDKPVDEPALANLLHDGLVHPTYNLVSCQMALHYFADASCPFWANLSLLLSRNGLFVATVPNGDFISEQLRKSKSGQYTVRIRDATTDKELPWYHYETCGKHSAYFHTPKINRSEEPLLLKASMLKAIRRDFKVVYMETFGTFTRDSHLGVYETAGDPFHAASIDLRTLAHTFEGKHEALGKPVHDTPGAIEYSKEGHYVVILCKKNGYTDKEAAELRSSFCA